MNVILLKIQEIVSIWLQNLGPFAFIIGIMGPFLEAFFPPFPLAAIATFNVVSFGLVEGFIYTAIGSILGSYVLFLLLRKLHHFKWINKFYNNEKSFVMLKKVHEKGFWPIVVIMCFPFTPSCVVSFIAAVSKMDAKKYFYALLIGKSIMVSILTVLGYQVATILKRPEAAICSIIAILIIFYFIKKNLKKKHLDCENAIKKNNKKIA